MLFQSFEEAELARTEGGFYAYLVADVDPQMLADATSRAFSPDWWEPGDSTVIRVGRVVVSPGNSNIARVRASMDFQDVPSGTYSLMFCDLGCRNPLADVVPTPFSVLEDPVVARLYRRVDRLEQAGLERKWATDQKLRRLRRASVDRADLSSLSDEFDGLGRELRERAAGMESRQEAVGRRLARLEASDQGIGGLPWMWLALGMALGTAVTFASGRGRRRAKVGPEPPLDTWAAEIHAAERAPDPIRGEPGR